VVGMTGAYYLSLPQEKGLSYLTCIANLLKVIFAMKIWEARSSAADAVQQKAGQPLFFSRLIELIAPLEAIEKMPSAELTCKELLPKASPFTVCIILITYKRLKYTVYMT
jgi:hypothetical protein